MEDTGGCRDVCHRVCRDAVCVHLENGHGKRILSRSASRKRHGSAFERRRKASIDRSLRPEVREKGGRSCSGCNNNCREVVKDRRDRSLGMEQAGCEKANPNSVMQEKDVFVKKQEIVCHTFDHRKDLVSNVASSSEINHGNEGVVRSDNKDGDGGVSGSALKRQFFNFSNKRASIDSLQ
ncbi:unnamed protein product [Trifolium pratense]|uniref:Uncharacterized protein n=1 Tax=Trifolium pratense TaxID=57577 RepID=A0ACB0JPU4_TRIPR|nr:unnamed protein product [Trifolium pratense]